MKSITEIIAERKYFLDFLRYPGEEHRASLAMLRVVEEVFPLKVSDLGIPVTAVATGANVRDKVAFQVLFPGI